MLHIFLAFCFWFFYFSFHPKKLIYFLILFVNKYCYIKKKIIKGNCRLKDLRWRIKLMHTNCNLSTHTKLEQASSTFFRKTRHTLISLVEFKMNLNDNNENELKCMTYAAANKSHLQFRISNAIQLKHHQLPCIYVCIDISIILCHLVSTGLKGILMS